MNEAHLLIHIPRQNHLPGIVFRTIHLILPQIEKTYEVLLNKSFWTWGCEMKVNEYRLAIGNEAVIMINQKTEKTDGFIGMDLLRLALDPDRTCQEGIQVISDLHEEYGQGGNCELSGYPHFDCSYILADIQEAYILETAGRKWTARKNNSAVSVSNAFTNGSNRDNCSLKVEKGKLDWVASFGDT